MRFSLAALVCASTVAAQTGAVFSGTGCDGGEVWSITPDCSHACIKVTDRPISSVSAQGIFFWGTTCYLYADDNCQHELARTSNAQGTIIDVATRSVHAASIDFTDRTGNAAFVNQVKGRGWEVTYGPTKDIFALAQAVKVPTQSPYEPASFGILSSKGIDAVRDDWKKAVKTKSVCSKPVTVNASFAENENGLGAGEEGAGAGAHGNGRDGLDQLMKMAQNLSGRLVH
ncbi:hypothetical protein HJFPF1_04430 [Paramyrothecium foliicola]|nr:hypothetical protein HJFPF1_04430 [Paramyrothecium foliicola]